MNLVRVLRTVLASGMIGAGVLHVLFPEPFKRAMPTYVPLPSHAVLVSGIAEIAGGCGLMLSPTRKPASIGLILLYLAIFPVNLDMAIHADRWMPPEKKWLLTARLPLQLLLIWWAYSVGSADHKPEPQ